LQVVWMITNTGMTHPCPPYPANYAGKQGIKKNSVLTLKDLDINYDRTTSPILSCKANAKK